MRGRRRTGRFAMATVALVAALVMAGPARAQYPSGRQWGGRADVIASRAPTVQVGASLDVVAALYVRLEGTLAAGVAARDGKTYGAARADAVARFVLDPFAESHRTLYGIGGVSLMYDGLEEWRPRLVAGVGNEGRPAHGRVVALEVALGGGARLGIAVRGARSRGR